ncbi:MAG: type II toxin-antitoxin system VapC family toxin [Rickettsiales bacterium]|nr:type II toxin-antitoxin system VapC family toxin [Rickettsiales bacterium]
MTKYLLDTCSYIWLLTNEQNKLSKKARDALMSDGSTTYISIISQIEMTAKNSRQKIKGLSEPIIHYFKRIRVSSGIELLNLTQEDIEETSNLPKIHSDPFDRLLISQALNNQMTLISPDEKFLKYPVRVVF